MRGTDFAVLGLVVVQAVGGLAAAAWRATRPARRRSYDLTDMTALSRSASPPLRPR